MSKETTKKFAELFSPQLPYRFRMRITGKWLPEDQHTILTANVESVDIDYLEKKLVVKIRQNASSTLLHEAIYNTLQRDLVIIHVDSLDGTNGDPVYILEFDAKPVSHDFKFDYTETKGVATHVIEFAFEHMLPYNKKEEQNGEVE
jgi:hypothetical protein